MPTRLLVTLGDPRGIGPEVTAGAICRLADALPSDRHMPEIVIFGADPRGALTGVALEHGVDHPFDFDGTERSAGEVAGAAIEAAVAAAGPGTAVVTAPIHKPALRSAGYPEPGHTELLQRLTGVERVGMLMAAERTRLDGPLRVLLATTHLALRDVPAALTTDLLVGQTELLHGELRARFGIAEPRIALCAFNPHASDGGLFGDEESRIYGPALERLTPLGVAGPLPADTVFSRTGAGEFDAVVAPYHDVGMAAFKTVSFGSGVNVTLGLPFPRTSPDHGTAFDRVGTDTIDPSSMLEALLLGTRLAYATSVGPSL